MRIFRTVEEIATPPTAVALGFFDGVHIGHQAVIHKSVEYKAKGLLPAVFTFTTNSQAPEKKKDNRDILTHTLKEKRLAQCGVEVLFDLSFDSFRSLTAQQFVEEIVVKSFNAKEISCGFNFHFGKGACGSVADLAAIAEPLGVVVNEVKGVCYEGEPVSSTRIRRCLGEGDLAAVNAMLGRPYTIASSVVEGNRLGRRLNFPTINQLFAVGQMVPRHGVYVTTVELEGKLYGGVTNVGTKPTVGSYKPLVETYILGFEGDLYGTAPELHFHRFVRPEEHFKEFEMLRTQISLDVESAYNYFATNGIKVQ